MIDFDVIFVLILFGVLYWCAGLQWENAQLQAAYHSQTLSGLRGDEEVAISTYHPNDSVERARVAANTMDALMWYDS